ncbi:hypothetical protein VNO78_22779 [Psophocarpus tetragonolobus]|uniref:Uncharacterized protein n=1 Tax=Psophocarpus tetragonolobus TaxID=3891 RepID=A0AAN9S3E0_PSOTE
MNIEIQDTNFESLGLSLSRNRGNDTAAVCAKVVGQSKKKDVDEEEDVACEPHFHLAFWLWSSSFLVFLHT